MSMAQWELSLPISLGVFLALVVVMLLTDTHANLLRGPRRLASWLFNARGGCGCKAVGCKAGGACGCKAGGCKAGM